MSTSLIEFMSHQTSHLSRMATTAEQLGFCVVPHGVNPHTQNNRLYNFMSGGFGDLFDTWCRAHGRKYIRINTWYNTPIPSTGPLTDNLRHWSFDIPRTKRLRPIVVALDLVCNVVEMEGGGWNARMRANHVIAMSSRPVSQHHHDHHAYQGTTLDGLELMISILRMPNHQEILTDNYTPKLPRRR